ncbi:MAG: two pore domain potassium channel family protein [Deltaproteobacteria bacterium]|nr:two pore domain potassium channel family protein [Deltaproteobacteria bacterium]
MFQLPPDSFGNFPATTSGYAVDILALLPVLDYFSVTTLSTLGFEDITPLTLQTHYAAVAERITGQFYMAILVARLVGLQMSRPADQQASSAAAD